MAYHIIPVHSVVNLTGLDEAVVRLLGGLGLAYPLALFYLLVLYKRNPLVQHVFLTLVGLFLAVLMYGLEGLHTLAAVVGQYLLIHIAGRSAVMIVASFAFQMIYLIVGYVKYSTDDYDIAWTTAQCIIVLRLLGVAWDYYDGSQDMSKVSADVKLLSLKTSPSFLQMTGHAYFFGSFVVGPQFPMQRYLSFVHGTLIPIQHDQFATKVKKGLLRFASGALYLAVFQLFAPAFNNQGLLSTDFQNFSLPWKIVYITIWGRVTLCKYLGVWLVAEGSCIMTGLTYNGQDDQAQAKWDALKNCKLRIYETSTTLQEVIDSFNVNTNMWMSRYLFKRLRFLGNKTLSHLVTLFFLAIWHGVYIGYFVCFFSEYVYMTAERQFLRVIKTMNLKSSGPIYWIRLLISYIFKNIVMSYCLLPFCLLTLPRIYKVYSLTYALPHFLVAVWLPLYAIVLAPLVNSLEKGEEKKTK